MTASPLREALSRDVNVRARFRQDSPRILLFCAWALGILVGALTVTFPFGIDSHCYWIAWHRPVLYSAGPATADGYLYSPAFAEAIWPLAQLPWSVFAILFSAMDLVLLIWLLRPLGWRWTIPLGLMGLPEIQWGNVFIPMAVVCVLGFARPGLWAFPLLTKIAPGLGPVWFAVRREWRSLWISLAVTVAVVAASVAINPAWWVDWIRFLVSHAGENQHAIGESPVPFVYRAPVGVCLVVWGALRSRRWTLPVAMMLCTPVMWFGAITLLAGIPRSRQAQGGSQVTGGRHDDMPVVPTW